jgi:hypothetical protein
MAASVPLSANKSIPDSMLGSVLENTLGSIPGSGFGVNLEASLELSCEHRVKQAWNQLLSTIGSILEMYFGVYLKVS